MSVFSVSGTVLDTWDVSENKTGKNKQTKKHTPKTQTKTKQQHTQGKTQQQPWVYGA